MRVAVMSIVPIVSAGVIKRDPANDQPGRDCRTLAATGFGWGYLCRAQKSDRQTNGKYRLKV